MYNILINNLSTVNLRATRGKYLLDLERTNNQKTDIEFEGVYTSEIVPHALIKNFADAEQNEKIDLIYSLASDKVRTEALMKTSPERPESDIQQLIVHELQQPLAEMCRMTHYDFFQSLIRLHVGNEYAAEGTELENLLPEFIHEEIPDVPDAKAIYQAVVHMGETVISRYKKHPDGCCLYMDYTGGDRSTATIMIALTKMLEERGIYVNHIWSVHFNAAATIKANREGEYSRIKEKIEVNYIFDFISGLYEFTHYGRSTLLNDFFAKSKERGSIIMDDDLKAIQQKIGELSDVIQLCASSAMEAKIGQLVNAIKRYEKKAEQDKDPLINYLITDIKNNYEAVYETKNRTTPNIIRWCLDKNLIQQAVTMYVELVPEVIVDKKVIAYDESDRGWMDSLPEYQRKDADKYDYITSYILQTLGRDKKHRTFASVAENVVGKIAQKQASAGTLPCIYAESKINLQHPTNKKALENLLINYQIFRKRVRHAVNHAKSISIRDLQNDMKWQNEEKVFPHNEAGEKAISVNLIAAMLYDLVEQLDRVIALTEKQSV